MNRSGRTWLALPVFVLLAASPLHAQNTYDLQERLASGARYHVRMRVELSGSLTSPSVGGKPGRRVTVNGTSSIDYDERVLAVDARGQVSKTLRICERLDFRRTLAGQAQELSLRPGVRRLIILRKGHTEVPFSPDGPLSWGEIDAVRTDVFFPTLPGLLPGRSVAVGERWQATAAVVQELTDLEKIDEGGIDCRLEGLVSGRQMARVSFSGTVRGVGEDGPVRHRLQGHLHFDLTSRTLADLTLLGTTTLVNADGKEVGKIEGRLVLTRSRAVRPDDLSDRVVGSLKLEPDDDNTQMLYDNPDLGLRFLHSRRWRVAQVMGTQVALAAADGSGVLLTVDPPNRVPTALAFLDESRQFLQKQKARLVRTYSPRRMRDRPTLDAFALEAEMGKQRLWLDYYVSAQSGGGVTIAARLLPTGLNELRREVEAIARSATITKRITPPPAPVRSR